MALLTGRSSVQPHKRERCEVMMETIFFFPTGLAVTSGTVHQGIFLGIVGCMAIHTVDRQRIGEVACVARRAGLVGVRAFEFVVSFRQVIEAHDPIRLLVAAFALGTIAAKMHIIAAMAADTVCGQSLVVGFRDMTVATLERSMSTGERKVSFCFVVESGFPGL